MDQFRISATGSGPNYLPEYVSRALGFFASENIEASSWVPNPWTGVLEDIDTGAAEAALGGLWLAPMYYGRVRNYVAFAQLNARFPMALVVRTPATDAFDFRTLEDKVVLVPGTGGVAPFQFLRGLLVEVGVDTTRITFAHDLSSQMFSAMFAGGTGDALVVDGLTAASLVSRGIGRAVVHLDEVGGPMPNSVYYAPATLLERDDRIVSRFTRALQRGMDWLQQHPAGDLEALLRERWPHVDVELLIALVEGFRKTGVWAGTVRIDEAAYTRWHDMLVRGGLISSPVAYADVIDSHAAEEALRSTRSAADFAAVANP